MNKHNHTLQQVGGNWVRRRCPVICHQILIKHIQIPVGTDTLEVCFTKRKPAHGQHFTLTAKGRVKEYKPEELYAYYNLAKQLMRKAYRDGYRYLYFKV